MRFIFCFLLLFPLWTAAQTPVDQATQKELWNDPQWHALLHYKDGESTIDSKAFFNAPEGKTDPKAELIATLEAFSEPAKKEYIEKIYIQDDITQDFQHQHAQCAFPARYAWLSQKLNLSSIPRRRCAAYRKWLKKIRPHQATLVFASAYLNQPSSLFGHTFLRFDRKSKDEDLLSYISNFGAITPPDPNGFAYAYNGLTGGYPGVFSFQPYYEKVKTYGAIENRDLWEYELNLSKSELYLLVAHVWELGYQYVDYYFFTDNCSYLLMEMLDVVRPQMKLSDQFPSHAIPLDTVRVTLAEKGLIGDVDFRASMQTKILSHWQDLSTTERDAVRHFRRTGELPKNLTDTQTARVAEVAYDAMQYDLAKGKISTDVMRPRAMRLLRARNKIAETEELFPAIKTPIRPDKAHESARLSLAGGMREDHEILSFSLRPAYHTTDDLDDGHVFGAGLNFLHGEVQYDFETDELYLNQLELVAITSLSPWQATFRPTSWKLGVRLDPRPTDWDRQMGTAYGALGISFKLAEKFLVHLMAEGQASYADRTLSKNPMIGAGGSLGLVWAFHPKWKLLSETKQIYFSEKKDNDYWDTKASLFYYPSSDWALAIDYRYFQIKNASFDEVKAGVKWYF